MRQNLTTVESIDRSQRVIYPQIIPKVDEITQHPQWLGYSCRVEILRHRYLYYGAGTVKVIAVTTHDLLRVSRFHSRTAGNQSLDWWECRSRGCKDGISSRGGRWLAVHVLPRCIEYLPRLSFLPPTWGKLSIDRRNFARR